MFDQERCISCSRCIRFCDEIAGSPQLTFVQRGEKVTIETFPGSKLDNPYSMNVIEICPVGALTSRNFRFKARVWDMSRTDSICTGCARGCNMNIWTRDNKIMRLTPRENPDVNGYWMCDYGRLNTFNFVNDEQTRVNTPMVRPIEAGILDSNEYELQNCEWDDAIARTIGEIKNYKPEETGFIASPFTTLEDNYTLLRFAKEVIGSDNICYIPKIEENDEDDLLVVSDKTPDSRGLELLGIKPIIHDFTDAILRKKIKLIYIIHDTLSRLANADELMKNLEVGIVHISNFLEGSKKASVIFPATTYAESNGTFVNFNGRVQRIRPAVTTLEIERQPGDFTMSRLDKFGAHNDRWTRGVKYNARPVWKVITQMARVLGTDFGYENTEDVFDDITQKIEVFAELDYEQIGRAGVLTAQVQETIA